MDLTSRGRGRRGTASASSGLLADLLDGYSSTMDTPASMTARELLRVFPRRRRDLHDARPGPCLLPRARNLSLWLRLHERLNVLGLGYSGFPVESIPNHEDRLRRVVPPGKPFFYRVSKGRGPLCNILDVTVPDRPLQHNNNVDDARVFLQAVMLVGCVAWPLVIGAASGVAWMTWKSWSRG